MTGVRTGLRMGLLGLAACGWLSGGGLLSGCDLSRNSGGTEAVAPNLHTCVATFTAGDAPVALKSWGRTPAEAQRAASRDGRIVADTLQLADTYGPTLTGGEALEPELPAVNVADCAATAIDGPRFSVTWPGGEPTTRDTPSAALSAARRRTCGQAVQATLGTATSQTVADFRARTLSCWTAEPPAVLAVKAETTPAPAPRDIFCDLPHDELRSAAFGVGSTRDDALEAALRSRALTHLLRGQANAAGAMSAESTRRPTLAATGFVLAAGFVVPHPELEQAAAHCNTLAQGSLVGSLSLDDRDFVAQCTPPPPRTLPGGVGGLSELPAAVDALCSEARQAHLQRRASEGLDRHAAWSQAARCAALCRARVQFADARFAELGRP